ncbi:MAG: hypothetical protein BWK80_41360 [Desulfobacteraceae bacterium IS3]|nr:MAG: hypothetical protein BWK80_41360 [Desulfobacteraceae bacterium IS3]
MTTIISIFILSLALSLILTPQVRNIALKYNIIDIPSDRKVHSQPIPRIGGVSIYLSFFLPFLSVLFYSTQILDLLSLNTQMIHLILGASMVFGLGVIDDIWGLGPKLKFAVQITAAVVAYAGGIKITIISLPLVQDWHLAWLSLPVTIFWFVLVINAINLIDGLDGLAAGISLFASLVLLVLCVISKKLFVAMGLAALGGATLGFLRYNFNPASIFMGDSGSYFLGYMLAALSIMGAIKSQTTVAMLIPVIALGVPLIDTVIAPIRRFILGQRLFHPDKGHLHHKLMKYGFTHRNAVLVLYVMAISMGIISVILVNTRDDGAAMILVLAGIVMFINIRKIGYFDYFGAAKVYNWLRDITDEVGVTHERRNFLNLQVEIYQSEDMKTLWQNVCKALDKMGFDMAEMYLEKHTLWQNVFKFLDKMGFDVTELNLEAVMEQKQKKIQPLFVWTREGFDDCEGVCKECLMKLELPLLDGVNKNLGFLWLVKDLRREAISHYTLRRVENLRQTVLETLKKIEQVGNTE